MPSKYVFIFQNNQEYSVIYIYNLKYFDFYKKEKKAKASCDLGWNCGNTISLRRKDSMIKTG